MGLMGRSSSRRRRRGQSAHRMAGPRIQRSGSTGQLTRSFGDSIGLTRPSSSPPSHQKQRSLPNGLGPNKITSSRIKIPAKASTPKLTSAQAEARLSNMFSSPATNKAVMAQVAKNKQTEARLSNMFSSPATNKAVMAKVAKNKANDAKFANLIKTFSPAMQAAAKKQHQQYNYGGSAGGRPSSRTKLAVRRRRLAR